MRLFVFFSTAPSRQRVKDRIIDRLILRLTQCEFVHVAVGDELLTISPRTDGDRVVNTSTYARSRPTLAWMVVVDNAKAIQLPAMTDFDPVPVFPSILRRVFGSIVPTRDCVQRALAILSAAGIHSDVPITSPAELWDFLRSCGYEFVDVTGTAHPCPSSAQAVSLTCLPNH